MTTTRRKARHLAGQRRRQAAASTRSTGLLVTGAPRAQAQRRSSRPPLVLHVALPAHTPPFVRDAFDEAAHRIVALALVQFTVAARLPNDVPFFVRLPGSRYPSVRRARAVVAFVDALADVFLERLPVLNRLPVDDLAIVFDVMDLVAAARDGESRS